MQRLAYYFEESIKHENIELEKPTLETLWQPLQLLSCRMNK